MNTIVERFKSQFSTWNSEVIEGLDELYCDRVVFVDPVHRVQGLGALKEYFLKTQAGLNYCEFIFNAEVVANSQAMLVWDMVYSHKKLNQGEKISLSGSSWIVWSDADDGKVSYHQDFYDLSAMVFDHVPILGRVSKSIKRRIANA